MTYLPDEQRLLDRLRNDQLLESEVSEPCRAEPGHELSYRRGHNDGMRHAIEVVAEWLDERVMERAARRYAERCDEAYAAVDGPMRTGLLDDDGDEVLL